MDSEKQATSAQTPSWDHRLSRWLPWAALALACIITAMAFRLDEPSEPMNLQAFGQLPVQEGGRINPLDTIARTYLLIFRGKGHLELPTGEKLTATEWLAELTLQSPEIAANYPVFRIDHPDIVGMLGEHNEQRKYFSFQEIFPHLATIDQQAMLANDEAQLRTPYESAIVRLRENLQLYDSLTFGLQPPPIAMMSHATEEYGAWNRLLENWQQIDSLPESEQTLVRQGLSIFATRYERLAPADPFHIVPMPNASKWLGLGESLLHSAQTQTPVNPVVAQYAALAQAYAQKDAEAFNATVGVLKAQLHPEAQAHGGHIKTEFLFNQAAPFQIAMVLYVLIFLLGIFSWLCLPRSLGKAAYWILILTLIIHTAGLLLRMYIQGRPPVTNLYSSAIFVGWGATLLACFLEKLYRNSIGSVVAAMIGFSTLIIAQALAEKGDTLEMMRAVLDSNFWLATHVVTITLGYSATFLAGFLAIVHIVRGTLTKGFDKETAQSIERMVYGIVCFGLFFSFVGTVLGGIWADQSWGRFWGWDPKENGALMIVLWNAMILHARWGKLCGARGLMQLAVGGNIITAWSWFGTNMLGVGLHSYGFMDSAFFWLIAFVFSQLGVMALAALPGRYWNSPAALLPRSSKTTEA